MHMHPFCDDIDALMLVIDGLTLKVFLLKIWQHDGCNIELPKISSNK